jgi:hypothetical protein
VSGVDNPHPSPPCVWISSCGVSIYDVCMGSESSEDERDVVLTVLSSTERALTDAEICSRVKPALELRQVRIALRDLAASDDVAKDESGRWKARVPTPELRQSSFSEAELKRARARFPGPKSCPECGKMGNIEPLFGWRRLNPEDTDIVPHSWCSACR